MEIPENESEVLSQEKVALDAARLLAQKLKIKSTAFNVLGMDDVPAELCAFNKKTVFIRLGRQGNMPVAVFLTTPEEDEHAWFPVACCRLRKNKAGKYRMLDTYSFERQPASGSFIITKLR